MAYTSEPSYDSLSMTGWTAVTDHEQLRSVLANETIRPLVRRLLADLHERLITGPPVSCLSKLRPAQRADLGVSRNIARSLRGRRTSAGRCSGSLTRNFRDWASFAETRSPIPETGHPEPGATQAPAQRGPASQLFCAACLAIMASGGRQPTTADDHAQWWVMRSASRRTLCHRRAPSGQRGPLRQYRGGKTTSARRPHWQPEAQAARQTRFGWLAAGREA
jgi:hypothetical protein